MGSLSGTGAPPGPNASVDRTSPGRTIAGEITTVLAGE